MTEDPKNLETNETQTEAPEPLTPGEEDYKEVEGGMTEISATDPKTKKTHTVYYNFGKDTTEAVAMFGDKVVHSNFVGKSVITAQAIIRRGIRAGKSFEEITEIFKTWKPGVAIERTFDPLQAALNKFDSMTPEEQAAFIADLTAKARK